LDEIMGRLTIDLWTFDVGVSAASPEAYAAELTSRAVQSWDGGADVVVFPEYAWMGLARFIDGKDELRGVADLFWNRLWPGVRESLAREGKAVVAGTVPCLQPDGTIRNRAPIVHGADAWHQDKLFLTPWESALGGGDAVRLWKFRGATFAVLICLDIEVPELSAALRARGVDCILVPSATETMAGLERVGRCASARAVELGCYVGVSHVVGRGPSAMVDENIGRLAWFAPSQQAFLGDPREEGTAPAEGGFHRLRAELARDLLDTMRRNIAETNPARLTIPGRSVAIVPCE
jgi:predicted amidohydrolase